MRLTLFRPNKPFQVGQAFGANDPCSYPDKTGVTSPLPSGSCPPGKVKLYPLLGMKGHTGLDLRAGRWEPLYSSTSGFVEELQTEEARGLGIGIITNEKYEFHNQISHAKVRYWHLAGMNVKKGDKVTVGQLIGWTDSTGLSSGDHLHFELKPVAQNGLGTWYNIYQANGYFGAVDPFPYMSDQYALEALSAYGRIKEYLALFSEDVATWLRGNYEKVV